MDAPQHSAWFIVVKEQERVKDVAFGHSFTQPVTERRQRAGPPAGKEVVGL